MTRNVTAEPMHSALPVHGVRTSRYIAQDMKPSAPSAAIDPMHNAANLANAI